MKQPEHPIRVMIVDDHALVRRGVVSLLSLRSDMQVVAEADDGPEAIELHRQHRPDVTLIDLRMPTMAGVDVITQVRAEAPNSRFVVVTTYETDDDVFRAIQAGAQGYVLKASDPDDLVETILGVHRGERRIPAHLANRIFDRLGAPALNTRELEILTLLVRGQTNKEIGAALDLQESTVKWHMANIMVKLGVTVRTQAAVVALQRGLVKPPER